MKTPAVCPVCGEDLPRGAKACPECGADERTGWREDAEVYDGLDLPDEAWEDEDRPKNRPATEGPAIGWKIAAGIVLLALLWWKLRSLFG